MIRKTFTQKCCWISSDTDFLRSRGGTVFLHSAGLWRTTLQPSLSCPI